MAQSHYRIQQHGQAGNMIEMGVRQKNMVNCQQCLQRQTADTRAGVDQHMLIQQKSSGPVLSTNTTTATQHLELHAQASAALPVTSPCGPKTMRTPSNSI